jgi:hypothetical protein
MAFAIQSLFPSITYPTIFLDEIVPAPNENVKRWLSTHDHELTDGRKLRVLITWSTCPGIVTTYEPLAEFNEDGTPLRFLIGMLQPDMTYRMATSMEDLAKFTQTVVIQNPHTNDLYQLPLMTLRVSTTLRNMVDDMGELDDSPIPIGANIINGTLLNTLQLLQMIQILGNPEVGVNVINNWNNSEVHKINEGLRIKQIDEILKFLPSIDEKTREAEIAAAIGYPQFNFAPGWTDYQAFDYYITAVDFLDIQPLCMYISHAYASKMATIL